MYLSLFPWSFILPKLYPDSLKESHTAVRDWIQKYNPKRLYYRKTKIFEFIVDEIIIKVGSEYIWLWIAIENDNREILQISISKERNMFVAERFISLENILFQQMDGGPWYPQACRFLRLQHHIHSSYEKSIIERTVQSIKDRTEGFDDYFPCRKN